MKICNLIHFYRRGNYIPTMIKAIILYMILCVGITFYLNMKENKEKKSSNLQEKLKSYELDLNRINREIKRHSN